MSSPRPTCCNCPRPARPGGRYCRECHAAKMREWRQKRVYVKLPAAVLVPR